MKQEDTGSIHRVLARKWRPGKFAEVVGQQHVLLPLTNSVRLGKLHHAYLLTGTRGVGKTSLARILAKAICCQKRQESEPCGECPGCQQIAAGRYIDLIEVDAASRSKVEETRELIENLHYSPASGGNRVYIIDEVHMFSRHSFNALLKVLEEPPDHVTFILATTDYRKIPNTILSRCLQFHLRHLSVSQIAGRLAHILEKESIPCDKDALTHIARAARGSMRDALSLLDQAISCGQGTVESEPTRAMLGIAGIDQAWKLIEHLAAGDLGAVIATIDDCAGQAVDCGELLDQTISFLQNLALVKSFPDLSEQESFRAQFGDCDFRQPAGKISVENLHLYEHIATDTRMRFWVNPSPERALKLCFARMLAFGQTPGAGGKADPAPAPSGPATRSEGDGARTTRAAGAAGGGLEAAPDSPSATARPGRDEKQNPEKPPAEESSPAGTERTRAISTNKDRNDNQEIDILRDLRAVEPVPLSESMKSWRQVVQQLENDGLPPDIAFCLRQSVELVRSDKQQILRYGKKAFRNKEAMASLTRAAEMLTQQDSGAVDLQETDSTDTSLNLIEQSEQKQAHHKALQRFAQDPVVCFLRGQMKARLTQFERKDTTQSPDTGQSPTRQTRL